MDTARGGAARRLLCRLGFHRTEFLDARALGRPFGTNVYHPCRHERRCAYCGWVQRASLIHDYGDPLPTDHPCRTRRVCTRCGTASSAMRHEFHRLVPVADLLADERPRYLPQEERTPCDYARFCRHCGLMEHWAVTEHDWDVPKWGGTCGRCGARWVDDGDD